MKEALLLLLLLHFSLLSFSSPYSSPESPSSSPPSSPVPPPPPPPSGQQLSNIMDALIGAADFWNLANFFAVANTTALPVSATLFIPRNSDFLKHSSFDPFAFPYHVIPQRLSFSDLQFFNNNDRLPTLLPGKSIIVTNNSISNFTINDSFIVLPDLYLTPSIAVHGIETVLNYFLYGDDSELLRGTSPRPKVPKQPKWPKYPKLQPLIDRSSACLGTNFPVLLLALCAALCINLKSRIFND